MNCAAASVIMQLLSPQDWLDGIQAAFLVITIFPMFATLFVTPTVQNLHFAGTLSKFNGAVSVWQFKACEDRSVGALFISAHLEKLYPTLVIKFPEKGLRYGKICPMSPNSDLGHLKGYFFTSSIVWRFRFVIFIAPDARKCTNAFK